jgi:hypothetical protein
MSNLDFIQTYVVEWIILSRVYDERNGNTCISVIEWHDIDYVALEVNYELKVLWCVLSGNWHHLKCDCFVSNNMWYSIRFFL